MKVREGGRVVKTSVLVATPQMNRTVTGSRNF